jgi:hypothetical protein
VGSREEGSGLGLWLVNVSPRDRAVFVGTTFALLAVAVLACRLPASIRPE